MSLGVSFLTFNIWKKVSFTIHVDVSPEEKFALQMDMNSFLLLCRLYNLVSWQIIWELKNSAMVNCFLS